MTDDVIDKVRKLLALADAGSGATDGERDAALAAATRVMARYQLDEADVRAAGTGPARPAGIDAVDFGSYPREMWWLLYDLAYVIGQVVTVDAVYVEDPPGVRNVSLIGRAAQIGYVRAVHGWVVPQLQADAHVIVEAERGYRRLRGDFTSALDGLTIEDLIAGPIVVPGLGARRRRDVTLDEYLSAYRESFYRGACARIYERLSAIHAAVVGDRGTDLVVSDRAALDAYYGDDAPQAIEDKDRADDIDAMRAGAAVGDRIDLDPSNKVDSGQRAALHPGAAGSNQEQRRG